MQSVICSSTLSQFVNALVCCFRSWSVLRFARLATCRMLDASLTQPAVDANCFLDSSQSCSACTALSASDSCFWCDGQIAACLPPAFNTGTLTVPLADICTGITSLGLQGTVVNQTALCPTPDMSLCQFKYTSETECVCDSACSWCQRPTGVGYCFESIGATSLACGALNGTASTLTCSGSSATSASSSSSSSGTYDCKCFSTDCNACQANGTYAHTRTRACTRMHASAQWL
jgi:hypothetical protein